MCKLKSGIILKDYIFMPNYNSHADMLKELGIEDDEDNAYTLFVRAELIPKNNDIFSDISTWRFSVNQNILPEWFIYDYDKQRMIEAVKKWAKGYIFEKVDNLELKGNDKYYLKNCKNVKIYNSCEIMAHGSCIVNAQDKSIVYMHENCKASVHDDCIVIAHDDCTVHAQDKSIVYMHENCKASVHDDCIVIAHDDCTVHAQDKCKIYTFNNCIVNAQDSCMVNVYDNCIVKAQGSCIVNARDNCKIIKLET